MKLHLSLPSIALAVLAAAPAISQVEGHHGQTPAEYQTTFDTLSNQGYRPIALSIHGSVGDERYSSVWINRAGPDWFGFHGATGPQYQAIFDAASLNGYTPKILTATGSAGNPRFAGTFEYTNSAGYGFHGLTESEFWTERTNAAQAGFQILTADIYGDNGSPRYIVAYTPTSVGQMTLISGDATSYQDHFNVMEAGHARPGLVATNDHGRYLSLWRSDNVGQWVSHHDMTDAQYQAQFDAYALQNRYPYSLQASGSGGNTRYAATWAPTDIPTPGNLTITGVAVPELAAFDTWVEDWMTQNEVRASNLAIVKQGRLVYCRGYTLTSDPAYPITQPATQCRIASCTKPLTSIGIHQHFMQPAPKLNPNDLMTTYLNGVVPLDAQCNNISIFQLLTHQGGWNRNVSPDPMLSDSAVATGLGIPYPISKFDVFNWFVGNTPLDFTPGTDSQYSNFGYSLLGQIIEDRNPGVDYETYMRRNVFMPLGITRPTCTDGTWGDLKPDEMIYHPYSPWFANNVMDPLLPKVAGQYGGFNLENMDSHGGWVMSAPDFAKVLSAFDLPTNPILDPTETANMWTVAPGYSTLMPGWFLRNVDDGNGGTVAMYNHNGRLIGSTNVIARRADGFSFVFFCNGDKQNLGTNQAEELSDIANTVTVWPNHDLFPSVNLPPGMTYTPGFMRIYGLSCSGALSGSGAPDIGQFLSLDIHGVSPSSPTFGMIGWPQPATPLDIIGMPGCRLYMNPVITLSGASNAGGDAQFPWQVPDDTSLIGVLLRAQSATIDPMANAFGLTLTNALDIHVGGWH
ncbi:MAG: serine hydrolase [Planctomycetes bacterium]|nr:serine hydrolase [Planctomycetota bacterium]